MSTAYRILNISEEHYKDKTFRNYNFTISKKHRLLRDKY